MNTIFTNSKNSKASNPQRLLFNLTDKIDLRRKDKYISFSNLSIYYTQKNIKKSCKNNKFKISAPTWIEEFESSNGSYSLLDIQGYFEYMLKKYREKSVNPSIKLYINKIENIKIQTHLKLKQDIISDF